MCALFLAACQAGASKPPPAHPNEHGVAVVSLEQRDEQSEQSSPSADVTHVSAVAAQSELKRKFANTRAIKTLKGEASYYADALAGRKTASGEPYNPRAFTAAHRKLPFGTLLRVVRIDTGAEVYVRINDRGPFAKRRILDLSRAAAERLGMMKRGVVQVRVEVVERFTKKH